VNIITKYIEREKDSHVVNYIVMTIVCSAWAILQAAISVIFTQEIFSVIAGIAFSSLFLVLFQEAKNKSKFYESFFIWSVFAYYYIYWMLNISDGVVYFSMFYIALITSSVLIRNHKRHIVFISQMVLMLFGLIIMMLMPYAQPDKDLFVDIASMVISAFAGFAMLYTVVLNFDKDKESALKRIESLSKISNYDELTRVFNRRHVEKVLKDIINKNSLNSLEFCVVIFDIDHFKKFNDTYGHNFGDEVLKIVANTANKCVGVNNTLGRWGGEEFLIVMPLCDLESGVILAEEIRKNIESLALDNGAKLTSSFGVAEYEYRDTATSIVERADTNLFRSKSLGRNRVSS
jgi:diguanylate cyclase (GGDEF)-like protein